jgi:hypothetical protein
MPVVPLVYTIVQQCPGLTDFILNYNNCKSTLKIMEAVLFTIVYKLIPSNYPTIKIILNFLIFSIDDYIFYSIIFKKIKIFF